jgi:hypothetical protein
MVRRGVINLMQAGDLPFCFERSLKASALFISEKTVDNLDVAAMSSWREPEGGLSADADYGKMQQDTEVHSAQCNFSRTSVRASPATDD